MIQANKSIVQCPQCAKALINIGSKVERIHPVARFIKYHDRWVILAWFVIFMPFIIWWRTTKEAAGRLGMSYGVFSLCFVPFVLNYFLLRAFPLYRITDCPYCGFHEKHCLGHSQSGEG